MSDSIHEFVVEQLERSKGQWSAVALASGVSKRTLEKIARREINDPGISHIDKLVKHYSVDALIKHLRGKSKSRRRVQ